MTKLPQIFTLYALLLLLLLLGAHIVSCARTAASAGRSCCEKTTDGSPTRCYPC